ncbi:hypothetical protein JQ604_15190 [Bradyrhizobium jicamae]|uniref:hypothetical protein n=1 Tax=Bradyrhizobium jicamae TaxID=280332 RepID=UPI001BA7452E|nr:hypothetical protein [Bradyrhizobium jicamae]MBR0753532.1 hypothetical protein [Bradyrhizobium jicamae]
MMRDPRAMIIDRIRTVGVQSSWSLDAYHHLVTSGVDPDRAIQAMQLFVDEVVAMKEARRKSMPQLVQLKVTEGDEGTR